MKVVLVSTSPRRKELLKRIVPVFEVVEPKAKEDDLSLTPKEMAKELALRKEAIYVAADTVVEYDGKALGKPVSLEEAKRMLKTLSGKWHLVHTGVAVSGSDRETVEVETTKVKFAPIEEYEIDFYVETYRPLDKAGGYGIQDGAELFVEKIEGSYSNVVGLPIRLTYKLMKECGFKPAKWVKLADIAAIVRSKNAGPFEVTFDIMFDDPEKYQAFKKGNFLTPKIFAELYGYREDEIIVFEYFDQALALKITARRKVTSGSIGDEDVYAAQQHVPLMNLLIPWKRYG